MNNDKYISIAEQVMNLARNVSVVNLRFMNTAISMLKLERYDHGSFCTDGEKLYYDPIFILKTYKQAKEYPPRFYLHSLLYCVFIHFF